MVTVSQGMREVHFENLLISGSEMRGIEVLGTAFISFTGGRISGNGVHGLQVGDGGVADVTDTEISNNGSHEVLAWGGGQIICLRCAISDDSSWGLGVVEGGGLSEPTWIQEFATGIATQGVVLGDLVCETGADFFCDGSVTKVSSTCGKCP